MFELVSLVGATLGVRYSVSPSPFLMGRDRGCHMVLRDSMVSRNHCQLEVDGETLWLRDLKSANPARINGKCMEMAELALGDVLSIGPYKFRVALSLDVQEIEEDDHSTFALNRDDSVHVHAIDSDIEDASVVSTEFADLLALMRWISQQNSLSAAKEAVGQFFAEKFNCQSVQLFVHREGAEDIWSEKADSTSSLHTSLLISGAERESNETLRAEISDGKNGLSCLVVPLKVASIARGSLLLGSSQQGVWTDQTVKLAFACVQTISPLILGSMYVANAESKPAQEDPSQIQFIGNSELVESIKERVRVIAPTDKPVLISGETGTGKELVATMIHGLSMRKGEPIIRLNCAAIPPELLASELFGHERGAFTGADSAKPGLLEHADGGTLFLDEIGDLRFESQAVLLRALETGVFRRLAGSNEISVNVRLISATNKELDDAVKHGTFREDLYHRIKGLRIQIPPLRQRTNDILTLAQHFAHDESFRQKVPRKSFSQDAIELIQAYEWPGNVRELKNTVELAVLLTRGREVSAKEIESVLSVGSRQEGAQNSLRAVEREHIMRVLERCHYNVVDAAKALGIGKSTLYSRLKDYGITIPKGT